MIAARIRFDQLMRVDNLVEANTRISTASDFVNQYCRAIPGALDLMKPDFLCDALIEHIPQSLFVASTNCSSYSRSPAQCNSWWWWEHLRLLTPWVFSV